MLQSWHTQTRTQKSKGNEKGSSMQKQQGKGETTIREAVVNKSKQFSTVKHEIKPSTLYYF